ncbi:MAG: hypothetical protein R3E89_12660 [Thiolinea sp.]
MCDAYLQQARQYTRTDVEQVCGVPLTQFDALAEYYAQAQCVTLSIGNGMSAGNGGSGLRAAMARQP